MTRDEKLEAMARAWCAFNGWLPDRRPMQLKVKRWDGPQTIDVAEEPGEPIWKGHVKAMDAILKAIGE